MNKCVRCSKEITDSDNISLSDGVSIASKCIDCSARVKKSFLERFKTICKPERPVTRKEYRLLSTITLSLTLIFLAGSFFTFLFISLFLSSLSGKNLFDSFSENLASILLTSAIPALLISTTFGVATALGIIKRSILEFTSLSQIQSNFIAVASIVILTITGLIFIFAILLGIVVSVRAIRRFRLE